MSSPVLIQVVCIGIGIIVGILIYGFVSALLTFNRGRETAGVACYDTKQGKGNRRNRAKWDKYRERESRWVKR